jgi:GNAT superfamily N-acetyltransferase
MQNVFDTMMDMDAALVICEAIGDSEETQENAAGLDPERFKAYAKSPSDIEESTLRDIAPVIDGKDDLSPPPDNHIPVATPSTLDRLLNSVTIVYITDNDYPVAAANLIDPTKEDYRGVVPIKYYSLLSGYNLDGRVQQEFFAVAEEYRNKGVGTELRAQINALDIPTFIVADSTDKDCIEGLARSGYQFVAQLDDETTSYPVQLWVDNADAEPASPENPEEPAFLDDTVELM